MPKKINDFILATAMVRASLDQNGVYDKYKKRTVLFTKKTGWYCLYCALKIHRKTNLWEDFGPI